MALLLKQLDPAISQYKDRRFQGTQRDFEACLHASTTIYVGNLSFFTTEDQIFEVRLLWAGGLGGVAGVLLVPAACSLGANAGAPSPSRLVPPCPALSPPPPAQVFSKVGDVKRIVMGLDKQRMTPCGFCFIVYYTREDAEGCVKWVNGTMLDDRPIRVDFDWGFVEGRQFGRGRSGGQVRGAAWRWLGAGKNCFTACRCCLSCCAQAAVCVTQLYCCRCCRFATSTAWTTMRGGAAMESSCRRRWR